jgi:hypothetical protein
MLDSFQLPPWGLRGIKKIPAAFRNRDFLFFIRVFENLFFRFFQSVLSITPTSKTSETSQTS